MSLSKELLFGECLLPQPELLLLLLGVGEEDSVGLLEPFQLLPCYGGGGAASDL